MEKRTKIGFLKDGFAHLDNADVPIKYSLLKEAFDEDAKWSKSKTEPDINKVIQDAVDKYFKSDLNKLRKFISEMKNVSIAKDTNRYLTDPDSSVQIKNYDKCISLTIPRTMRALIAYVEPHKSNGPKLSDMETGQLLHPHGNYSKAQIRRLESSGYAKAAAIAGMVETAAGKVQTYQELDFKWNIYFKKNKKGGVRIVDVSIGSEHFKTVETAQSDKEIAQYLLAYFAVSGEEILESIKKEISHYQSR